jgi:bacteriocin biosynthesis cyclodehydratase domain-containing protein
VADAVRLTGAASRSVALVGVGQFGERVCATLASECAGAEEFGTCGPAIPAAFSSGVSTVVLALWRPCPQLCEMADELSFRYLVPWLPVIMEHPVIRIGPLVLPPNGPCFSCYTRRRAQHDLQQWATAVLQQAYDHDQGCGPRGYLPHHARMAAALAHRALDALVTAEPQREATQEAGEITTIRLVWGDLRVSHLTACHDCDRCTASAPPVNSGWLTELAASLPRRSGGTPGRPGSGTAGPYLRTAAR